MGYKKPKSHMHLLILTPQGNFLACLTNKICFISQAVVNLTYGECISAKIKIKSYKKTNLVRGIWGSYIQYRLLFQIVDSFLVVLYTCFATNEHPMYRCRRPYMTVSDLLQSNLPTLHNHIDYIHRNPHSVHCGQSNSNLICTDTYLPVSLKELITSMWPKLIAGYIKNFLVILRPICILLCIRSVNSLIMSLKE